MNKRWSETTSTARKLKGRLKEKKRRKTKPRKFTLPSWTCSDVPQPLIKMTRKNELLQRDSDSSMPHMLDWHSTSLSINLRKAVSQMLPLHWEQLKPYSLENSFTQTQAHQAISPSLHSKNKKQTLPTSRQTSWFAIWSKIKVRRSLLVKSRPHSNKQYTYLPTLLVLEHNFNYLPQHQASFLG